MKLYITDISPPARAVVILSEMLELKSDITEIDLVKNEHTTVEYKQINPIHTVPTMEDKGLILHDSHAIMMYLVDCYAKNDSLYPKDLICRAKVNQKLLFHNSVLFYRLRNITYYAIFMDETKPNQRKLDEIRQAYGFLEEFLSENRYLALNHITIADIAAAPTVSALNVLVPINGTEYPKTLAWLNNVKSQPFYKINYSIKGETAYFNLLKKLIVVN